MNRPGETTLVIAPMVPAPLNASGPDAPPRDWFTAAELAELALPGLPGDKRAMNRRARDERWQLRLATAGDLAGSPLARPRIARGGGIEFHISLLPGPARLELAKRGLAVAGPGEVEPASEGAWRRYGGLPLKAKAEAARRRAVLAEVALLEEAGLTRTAAAAESAARHKIASSTLWNWLGLVEGVAPSDWLPALAPRHRGGGREIDVDPDLWDLFKSDFLRDAAPTLAICYAKCAAVAASRGLSLPSEKTLRRKLEREVPASVILLARRGEEALRRSLPAQRRSVAEFHAMELVNVDGHKFDVFVELPDGTRFRPILIGIQDVWSRKVLAWRIGDVESALLTRLAFADLFTKFGIPKEAYLDNGRAFASKWITGQLLNRFRFKVKEEEPAGLLTALGIKVHWTLPYRGQSKPIERAWKDLCDSIARSAAFAGAYTGNSTANKPESYGKRAVPIADFIAEVERGIAFHNARLGRRSEMARGRSFDETFAESYARAPIGKATPEQLRLALLTGENRRVNKQTGELALFGNRYWSPACGALHGQLVTVRFDPDDLSRDIHLYDMAGRYLGDAQMIADTGFADVAEAKGAARLVADHRKATKAMLAAERRLSAADVADAQAEAFDALYGKGPALPEPAVLRPVRALKPVSQAVLRQAQDEREKPAPRQHESRVFAALGGLKVVE